MEIIRSAIAILLIFALVTITTPYKLSSLVTVSSTDAFKDVPGSIPDYITSGKRMKRDVIYVFKCPEGYKRIPSLNICTPCLNNGIGNGIDCHQDIEENYE